MAYNFYYDNTGASAIPKSQTIDSNYDILVNQSETIDSDYTILTDRVQAQISSDYSFQSVGKEQVISSDYNIQNSANQTIDSDYTVLTDRVQENISSDYSFSAEGVQQTIDSEYTITAGTTYGISDIAIVGNKLILVENSPTGTLWETDLDESDSPNFTSHAMSVDSDESYEYPNAITINETFNYGYVACNNGKICKFDIDDLSSREEIDVSDTDNLNDVAVVPDFNITFASTDNANAELYKIDEATTKTLNTEFSFLKLFQKFVSSILTFINAKVFNADFRFLAQTKKTLNTELTFLTNSYATVQPLGLENISVELDGTEIPDMLLDSGNITMTVDDQIYFEFTLPRYFDKPDHTADGTLSQISNNNIVEVKFNDVRLFYGKIEDFSPSANNESISVRAINTEILEDKYRPNKTINWPIASLNTQEHIYNLMVRNLEIKKPLIDDLRAIIVGENHYWTGTEWSDYKRDAMVFNSFTLAEAHITAKDGNTNFEEYFATVEGYDKEPEYYNGVKVDLGISETESVDRYVSAFSLDRDALKTFEPTQNWTYFWYLVSATKYRPLDDILASTFGTLNMAGYYLGSSLNALDGEFVSVNSVAYRNQRIYDNVKSSLGAYSIGSAPFKTISCSNGRYSSKYRWEDRSNGLYTVKNGSYDNVQHAKDVAQWEYDRMKNINGDILPKVTMSAQCTLDAFLYYNVSLLNRINIVNTTQSNIYKNATGFPVSIKSISISLANMIVDISASNSYSEYELEELYPEPIEPDRIEEYSKLSFVKYDIIAEKYVS